MPVTTVDLDGERCALREGTRKAGARLASGVRHVWLVCSPTIRTSALEHRSVPKDRYESIRIGRPPVQTEYLVD